SRSRSTGDFRPSDRSRRAAASSTARESSVYGSENFMLSESSSTSARCDRRVSIREEIRTGSTSIAATAVTVSTRRATSSARLPPREPGGGHPPPPPPPRQPARLAAVEPPDERDEAGRRQHHGEGPRPPRQRGELQPRPAAGLGARRPLDPQECLQESVHRIQLAQNNVNGIGPPTRRRSTRRPGGRGGPRRAGATSRGRWAGTGGGAPPRPRARRPAG